MKQIKVYLAGKMSGLSFKEMSKWREEAKALFKLINIDYFGQSQYNILVESPCDYYNFQQDPSTYTEKEVKEFDLFLVRTCDLVLVNLNHPNSIGTAIEIELASRVWDIPVIGFGTEVNHPWIELCLTKKCNNLEDAVNHIEKFYLPNI